MVDRMEQLVRIKNLTNVVVLLAGSAAIVGCGSSSPPKPAAQPPVAAQRPVQSSDASNLDIGRGKSQQADQPTISKSGKHQKGHATPGLTDNDTNSSTSNRANPCTLVSLREARVITGGAISGSAEAPLGPTCVYELAHSKAPITLAVESSSFSSVTRQMTKRQQLTVRGHKAACGRLGSQMLFVMLPGGRLLHVTASCSVAERFASLAIGRLTA